MDVYGSCGSCAGGKEIATKLQIASDLHIEMLEPPQLQNLEHFIKPGSKGGEILALLGDIGIPTLPSYAAFLGSCSRAFKHVLVIGGMRTVQ